MPGEPVNPGILSIPGFLGPSRDVPCQGDQWILESTYYLNFWSYHSKQHGTKLHTRQDKIAITQHHMTLDNMTVLLTVLATGIFWVSPCQHCDSILSRTVQNTVDMAVAWHSPHTHCNPPHTVHHTNWLHSCATRKETAYNQHIISESAWLVEPSYPFYKQMWGFLIMSLYIWNNYVATVIDVIGLIDWCWNCIFFTLGSKFHGDLALI